MTYNLFMARQHPYLAKKAIIFFSCGIAILVVSTGIYLSRGLLRGPLVHWYAETVYLKKVEHFFDKDFKDTTPRLASLGLSFNTGYTGYLDQASECHAPMYEVVSVSTYCHKLYVNDNPGPAITTEFRERWRQESPGLEQYLLEKGWTKVWNADQPIDELLVRDDRGGSVGVNYRKYHDKITCELSIWYNAPSEQRPGELNARQTCNREVEFFGGY